MNGSDQGETEEATLRTVWKVAAVAAVVVVVGMVGVVVAQEPQTTEQGPFANLRQEIHQAIAQALGISVEKYDAAVTEARAQVLESAVQDGKLTQEQADRMRERMEQAAGPGMMGGFGRGMMGGRGGIGHGMMGGSQTSLIAVAADKLDMTVEELQAELEAGKTIADLAEEKDVDTQEIVDAFLAPKQEWLAQAVDDGRLTQEQADQMLDNMRTMVQGHIDGTTPFQGNGPDGCPGMGGAGRRGGMMNSGRAGRTF